MRTFKDAIDALEKDQWHCVLLRPNLGDTATIHVDGGAVEIVGLDSVSVAKPPFPKAICCSEFQIEERSWLCCTLFADHAGPHKGEPGDWAPSVFWTTEQEYRDGRADIAAGQSRVPSRGEEAGEASGAPPGEEEPRGSSEEAPLPRMVVSPRTSEVLPKCAGCDGPLRGNGRDYSDIQNPDTNARMCSKVCVLKSRARTKEAKACGCAWGGPPCDHESQHKEGRFIAAHPLAPRTNEAFPVGARVRLNMHRGVVERLQTDPGLDSVIKPPDGRHVLFDDGSRGLYHVTDLCTDSALAGEVVAVRDDGQVQVQIGRRSITQGDCLCIITIGCPEHHHRPEPALQRLDDIDRLRGIADRFLKSHVAGTGPFARDALVLLLQQMHDDGCCTVARTETAEPTVLAGNDAMFERMKIVSWLTSKTVAYGEQPRLDELIDAIDAGEHMAVETGSGAAT